MSEFTTNGKQRIVKLLELSEIILKQGMHVDSLRKIVSSLLPLYPLTFFCLMKWYARVTQLKILKAYPIKSRTYFTTQFLISKV